MNETMRTFLNEAVGLLTVHTENIYLRYRLRETMELAPVYTRGPRAHNPNSEPYKPVKTDKED
ncbi:MAG: hypothetical protein Q4F72_12915 [Desulfovibrionaceae bacterium]|nr:hypothetical protein [Desulfovibrionaceae bacterium]